MVGPDARGIKIHCLADAHGNNFLSAVHCLDGSLLVQRKTEHESRQSPAQQAVPYRSGSLLVRMNPYGGWVVRNWDVPTSDTAGIELVP